MNTTERLSRVTPDIDNPGWLKLLARVGFGAKGVVYVVLGLLALGGALGGVTGASGGAGSGDAGGGTTGALTEIVRQPFGRVLLSLVAIGLLAYGLWRLLQSTLDPENEGREPKALGKRIGWFCSGLAYLALAWSAVGIVRGQRGGEDGAESGTATLLSLPLGQWLVGIVGVGMLLAALHQAKQAITGGFRDEFALGQMSEVEIKGAMHAGRAGHAARTVLYLLVGGFLLKAAWVARAEEAGGLGKALDTLQAQPYGPWLLGIAGAGLVCYGLYCFVMARYRKAVRL